MPIRAILLLVFFLVSLPVCFFRPFYGILLLSVVSFLNPQSTVVYWPTAAAFPWALAVAIPTLCGLPFASNQWPRRLVSSKVFMLLLLWVWFTVTSVVSTHTALFVHHAQDTWDRWQLVSKIFLTTLATIAIVDTFSKLRILVIVISLCFGLIVLKSLPYIVMTGGAVHVFGPQFSMVADNNDLGLALNMTLPLFFFLARSESDRRLKWLFGLLFVVTIPAIFCTYSRGALLGLAAVFLLMFLRLKNKIILGFIVVLAVAAALLFAPDSWKTRMNPNQDLDQSALGRINAWTFSWNLAKDYPLFGGGFSTFTPELYERYAPNASRVIGPHSVYFGVLAEHGFFGLVLYLALLASCFGTTLRLVKYARIYGDQEVIEYANMFQISLTGFAVSGFFLGRAYFEYYWAIVACVAVLNRLAWNTWANAPEDETDDVVELVADHGLFIGKGIVQQG
jgi:probable O-glycosylation ligase (exosortase A-associated)